MKTERIGGLRARGRAEDKDEEGQFSGRKEHARRVCARARALARACFRYRRSEEREDKGTVRGE